MKKTLKVLAMTALLFVGTLTTISANEIIEIDGQKYQKIEESIKLEDSSKEELLETLSEDEVTEDKTTSSITDKETMKEASKEIKEKERRAKAQRIQKDIIASLLIKLGLITFWYWMFMLGTGLGSRDLELIYKSLRMVAVGLTAFLLPFILLK